MRLLQTPLSGGENYLLNQLLNIICFLVEDQIIVILSNGPYNIMLDQDQTYHNVRLIP